MSRETDVFARTIWGEAESEGIAGMEAVAAVVMNRAAIAKAYMAARGKPHSLFGDGTAAGACERVSYTANSVPIYQFSCWGDPVRRPKMEAVTAADPAFRDAVAVAGRALAGQISDPTLGAKHYEVRGTNAWWARGRTPSAEIGKHLFYNDIP